MVSIIRLSRVRPALNGVDPDDPDSYLLTRAFPRGTVMELNGTLFLECLAVLVLGPAASRGRGDLLEFGVVWQRGGRGPSDGRVEQSGWPSLQDRGFGQPAGGGEVGGGVDMIACRVPRSRPGPG
jgi:hypothetical protein